MFRPNTNAQLLKRVRRDIHGKEIFAGGVMIPCAVVKLQASVVESSVRADSSASRGAAEQTEASAKILVPKNVSLSKGDVLIVRGHRVEVMSIHDRFDALGRLDHFEVGGDARVA